MKTWIKSSSQLKLIITKPEKRLACTYIRTYYTSRHQNLWIWKFDNKISNSKAHMSAPEIGRNFFFIRKRRHENSIISLVLICFPQLNIHNFLLFGGFYEFFSKSWKKLYFQHWKFTESRDIYIPYERARFADFGTVFRFSSDDSIQKWECEELELADHSKCQFRIQNGRSQYEQRVEVTTRFWMKASFRAKQWV